MDSNAATAISPSMLSRAGLIDGLVARCRPGNALMDTALSLMLAGILSLTFTGFAGLGG